MIGLRRGTVKLIAHQASWTKKFNREARQIRLLLSQQFKDIQHIGSTAVPGIQAKPIIDMMIGVPSLRHARRRLSVLTRAGYVFRSTTHNNRWQYLYVKGPEHRRTVYLHVVRYGGVEWSKAIIFRDALIHQPTLARKYERLKQRLAQRFANDRKSYTDGKNEFITKVLLKETKRA